VTRTLLRSCLPALVVLAVTAPAAAASDPGAGGAPAPSPAEPPPPAPPAGVVSVDGPVAVVARADALVGRIARFRGSARRGDARRRVVVQAFDAAAQRWRGVARTEVGADGTFIARWRPHDSGRFRLRAVLRARPAAEARGSNARIASSELGVTVYRPALATWYGPGLFGNRTACGQVLTEQLQGVAHRTLPCGTRVALLYGGRRTVVEVVDRGPFGPGADWDLTQATARSLGLEASDTVGAVALP
jgi:rare lipoprotein A